MTTLLHNVIAGNRKAKVRIIDEESQVFGMYLQIKKAEGSL